MHPEVSIPPTPEAVSGVEEAEEEVAQSMGVPRACEWAINLSGWKWRTGGRLGVSVG